MTPTLALVLVLALLVGVSLGLLGGGGSILTVPLLVYVAGMDAKEAVATSLFVVGVTSAVGVVGHARGGRVRWRTGALFGAAGMAGAYTGGLAGGHLPGLVLLVAFAAMMIVTAVAMLRGRHGAAPGTGDGTGSAHRRLPVRRALLDGAVVGLVTGLVGAGGGFLVVPALALLGGLPMPVAVGTSLLVIAMKSTAGFAGYLTTVPVDWALTAAVTSAAVAGSLAGAKLAGRVPAAALSRAFAWFVLAVGTFTLLQQAPAELRLPALAVLASLGTGAGLCYGLVARCPLRRAVHSS
ncbi:sulfite exporter TauE/SafE family protein [Streptomyces sp. TRM 70361]|uniref:sulfite exporter TauE/SafE family protein n=1 Tax=Streptomyces sp. TRM 70361 TaxID=3116553 RepID=UPI002E7B7402|nr:sulfite exporter TauE/SafE family protein [Streptomyces sp. TRM 70361]MEE1942927.1 sulfite exporter TauE/SafE family protein [Streptomyces sp. TRM 70361]